MLEMMVKEMSLSWLPRTQLFLGEWEEQTSGQGLCASITYRQWKSWRFLFGA